MNGQVDRQLWLPPHQRRVIRRVQIQIHQLQQRADKPLGLAQGQVKQLAKGQGGFNRQIRIIELSRYTDRPIL